PTPISQLFPTRRSSDLTKVLGRKTYEESLRMGAKFDTKSRSIVFSRHPPPADAPSGVEFVNDAIGPFVSRLREQSGKDILLMGGDRKSTRLNSSHDQIS